MSKNTKSYTVTVTAGGKVTLADIKALRALGVTATGHRSLDVVQARCEVAGISLTVKYTDNATKVLAEGKDLGLLRKSTPKASTKGTKKASPKASTKGKVKYTKADGSVVLVSQKQADAWDAFKAQRVTVTQQPKAGAKAKVSKDDQALVAAVTAAVLKALASS